MTTKTYFLMSLVLATAFMFVPNLSAQGTVGLDAPPQATLDVVGKATDASVADGVIAPRLTLAQLQAKDAVYTAAKNGVIVYVTDAIGTPAGKTINVTAAGYYYFDGANLLWKGFGGAVPYQQIRGKVVTVAQATYTVQPDDYAIITNHSANVNVTFPDLTAADAGRIVLLWNNNTVALGNTMTNVTGNIVNNQFRGGTVMWSGTQWALIDK